MIPIPDPPQCPNMMIGEMPETRQRRRIVAPMPSPVKRALAAGVLALILVARGQTQTESATPAGAALQEHYDAAVRLQQQGNLDKAAAQYRVFLAEAVGELAIGRSQAGEYAGAESAFEESLALVPDSQPLRLEYAKTALLASDLPHAESLARAFLNDYPNSSSLAQAHQILGRTLLRMNRDLDARKELELAVALDPSFANGYDLAVACLDLDDEKCAGQLFTELQASFGDTAAIHMAFGRAYGNSDFAPRAVAEFRRAIALDPHFHSAHYCLAAALLDSSQDDKTMLEVETELKKELTISPNDFLTYAALGKVSAANRNYSQAEKYLKRSIALNSKSPDAYLYLGQMYFDTDRNTDADPDLRKAIQLTSDASRNHFQIQKAHFLLGRILMQEHRSDEAHAEMQIARTMANRGLTQDKKKLGGLLPDSQEIAEPSGASTNPTAVTQGNADPAAKKPVEDLEKLLTPAIADSYNNLGAIAATHREYTAAMGYFAHAGAWNPTLDGLDYNWGRAAFAASRFSDAIPPLSRYLPTHPDISGVRTALAISQFMTENYSGALATLHPAGEEIMSIAQMQYVYAESLVKTGQISEGTERLHALEAAHPEITEVHRSLGEVFAMQREAQKAIGEFENAIQIDPNDSQAHYDLGKVGLESGDAAAATIQLELAVKLQPANPEYHRELANAYRAVWRPADAEKELHTYETLAAAKAQPAKAGDSLPEPKLR
jgi:tetratricopeptide (TPR) repeat protein